jgi:hypothetical protein
MYNLSIIINPKNSIHIINNIENKTYDYIINEIKELYIQETGGWYIYIDVGWRDPEYIKRKRKFKNKFWKNIIIGRIYTHNYVQNVDFSESAINAIHNKYKTDIWSGAGASI